MDDMVDSAGRLDGLETRACGVFGGWQATRWLMACGIPGNAGTEIELRLLACIVVP